MRPVSAVLTAFSFETALPASVLGPVLVALARFASVRRLRKGVLFWCGSIHGCPGFWTFPVMVIASTVRARREVGRKCWIQLGMGVFGDS